MVSLLLPLALKHAFLKKFVIALLTFSCYYHSWNIFGIATCAVGIFLALLSLLKSQTMFLLLPLSIGHYCNSNYEILQLRAKVQFGLGWCRGRNFLNIKICIDHVNI